MSELLNQLKDEELDFTVRFTDTDGVYGEYEFLDIVLYEGSEYVVVSPLVTGVSAVVPRSEMLVADTVGIASGFTPVILKIICAGDGVSPAYAM